VCPWTGSYAATIVGDAVLADCLGCCFAFVVDDNC